MKLSKERQRATTQQRWGLDRTMSLHWVLKSTSIWTNVICFMLHQRNWKIQFQWTCHSLQHFMTHCLEATLPTMHLRNKLLIRVVKCHILGMLCAVTVALKSDNKGSLLWTFEQLWFFPLNLEMTSSTTTAKVTFFEVFHSVHRVDKLWSYQRINLIVWYIAKWCQIYSNNVKVHSHAEPSDLAWHWFRDSV